MATSAERNWTAHIVISFDHAGLKPHGKELEAEIYRVLARIDDPRKIEDYLNCLAEISQSWLGIEIGRKWNI
jgi:hypothetical protein